jgi:hypothetical protein
MPAGVRTAMYGLHLRKHPRDTLREKKMFAQDFAERRCFVLADSSSE